MYPVSIGCESGKEDEKRCGMEHEALIRRQWPGYEVLGILGEGDFGRVYEIAHKSSNGEARYAVKVIPAEKAKYPELLQQEGKTRGEIIQYPNKCVKEARVMQILKGHPHIVSIEDFAVMRERESNQSYMLIRMELLKPFSLWHDQRGELTQEDVVRIGIELCRAVEHCHRNTIIHCDIKLGNILVDAEDHIKLGDFGVAWIAEPVPPGDTPFGLKNHNSPEAYNKQLDPRNFESLVKADVFSVGINLYELSNADTDPFVPTDRPATEEERKIAVKVLMLGILPVPPPIHADGALSKIILKAIAHDPEQRYPSVRALREALEALSGTARTEPQDRNKEQTT